MSNLSQKENAQKGHPDEHGKDYVQVLINGNPYEIHRGRRTVAEIKQVGGIPLNYVLEQLIDDVITPLKDDGSVTIKGGEEFLGHIRDGRSS